MANISRMNMSHTVEATELKSFSKFTLYSRAKRRQRILQKKVCCTCKVKPYPISPLFVNLAVKNKEGGGGEGEVEVEVGSLITFFP